MNQRHGTVRICPDCGGIMQPTGPEVLTTAEVAASETPERDGTRQCLLCGYAETARDDVNAEPW